MYSIKVKKGNEWVFVGKNGVPCIYKNVKAVEKAMKKIDSKLQPRQVGAIPVINI